MTTESDSESSESFKCCGNNYWFTTMECSTCHTANPNRPQPTLKRRRAIPEEDINPNKTSYLVCGYIRNMQKFYILDIAKLCVQFYGETHLMYIGEVNNWFTSDRLHNNDTFKYLSNKSTCKLKMTPLTQYIDDTYQIIHGQFHAGWKRPIPWHGYLCINILTNEVHELIIGENKFSYGKDELILAPNKYLKLSEPLILQSEPFRFGGGTNSTAGCFLKPKNRDINDESIRKIIVAKQQDPEDFAPFTFYKRQDVEPFKLQHNIWTQFYENLWDLFITNRLYDDKKVLTNQHEIWYFMQFLWILSDAYMKIPYIVLNRDDLKAVFDGYDAYKDEKFNVKKDCNAEIIKYKKNEILECKCFMYYENHYYMWGSSTSQKLQEVIFKICKKNNKIVVTFGIRTVFDVRKRGRF